MRRRTAYVLLLGLVLAVRAWSQSANDVIYLQDGRERVGELLRITDSEIVFRVAGEAELVAYPREQVQRVDLTRMRTGDQARTVEELNDPLLGRVLERQPSKFIYPDSGHVTLYRLHAYTLEEDGSYALRERRIEKILQERGKDRANVARYFKKGEETLEIDFARTINPDGSITPISDAGVDITSVHAANPEYERYYQVKFAMKQIREGSVIDYQITTRRQKTDVLDPFHAGVVFQEREPIVEAELRISVPPGRELRHHADRLGDNIEVSEESEGDRMVYRFVAKACPRVVPESMMPPAADLYPRVAAALDSDWSEIGAAYGQALRSSMVPSDEIAGKVAELVDGVDEPEERARRIYHDFIQSFRQLWVWPSQYSYVPRPVSEVFTKRAGNTIDKAALLAAMFGEAGLEAAVVLVRTQQSGKLVEDLPCIRQFDDAVVAVDVSGGWRFCAVDDESVRFGQMPSEYQGTRGLLVTPSGGGLVDIPLNPPEREREVTTYSMRLLPGGDLKVEKTELLSGNSEIRRRSEWKDLKDEELRRVIEVGLTATHPEARLEDYTIENLHDVTRPLRFTIRYTLEDYAMRASDELLVFRLPELGYTAARVGKDTREFPMRWYLRSEISNEMTIETPEGFRVYYAGKDYEHDSGVASFSATFAAEGNTIRYRDAFVQQLVEAPRTAYQDYKATVETQARVPKEWIVLERLPG